MKENPDQLPAAVLSAQIFTGLQSGKPEIQNQQIQTEWLKLKSRIEESKQKKSGRQVFLGVWWKSIAASFILASGIGLTYFLMTPSTENYATDFTNKKTIVLSDGTEIILNANSVLTTKNGWRFAVPREIWLEGEAYFNVKSHQDSPELKQFVVHTKDLDVRVVGTQFNVNTRKNATRVFLDEGRVQLSLKENLSKNIVVMNPGDFVGYSSEEKDKKEIHKNIDPEVVTSWRAGYYTFNHTPLSEVIEVVEATQGIKIKVANPALLKETVTGKIPNDNIDDLVKSMTRLFNLSYSMKGSELILKEK
jgi:ferric-dicitrate binding protein FerR (iron transport regulator)